MMVVASGELANLTRYVSRVLERILQERGESLVSDVLPSVQGLYDDLRHMVDTRTPYTDNRSLMS